MEALARALEGTLAAAGAKSAINAVKSDTSLAIVPKAEAEADMGAMVRTKVATAVATEAVEEVKLVTHVEVRSLLSTCYFNLANHPRLRSHE